MLRFLFFGFCLLTFFSQAFSEGTASILKSLDGHGKLQIQPSFSDFGLYDKANEYKLYIRIKETGEKIYYGFGDMLDEGDNIMTDVLYRIKDPNGNIVVPEASVPINGAINGYIASYNQAINGPTQCGNSSGYTAKLLSITSSMPVGDYWIEFKVSSPFYDRRKFKFFDITVATSGNVAIPGRVHSAGWQFTADALNFQFFGKLWVYASDGIVTSLDFNGMEPFVFTVFCNPYGCINTGNFITDRKSLSGKHYLPQYHLFLNDPDPLIYLTGQLGIINPPIVATPNCDGSALFNINVSKPGRVEFILQINPLPGVQPEDRILQADVVTGNNSVSWDGFDGLGNAVINGTIFSIDVTYINGLTNLPIYDVEEVADGFLVQLTRPTGPALKMYWDDSNLGGTTNLDGCSIVLPTTGCHPFGYSVGNNNTVNTWWYAASPSSVIPDFISWRAPQPLGAIAGDASFCTGSGQHTYSVSPDPNSTSYVWNYTGSGVTFVGPSTGTSVILDFGPLATSGTLSVAGNNTTCGVGMNPSTKVITINPGPTVTVTPPVLSTCSYDPPFLLTGGDPPGGIYSEGGLPLVSFDPQTATPGAHTILYTVTDAQGCVGQNTQTIHVNTAPTVTMGFIPDVCINSGIITLTQGAPSGGSYSGTGIVNPSGVFNPAVAGAGTFTITYNYTDANGCSGSSTGPVTVNPIPGGAGPISGNTSICDGDQQPYTINAIPNATIYSWTIAPASAGVISGTNTATLQLNAGYTGNPIISVFGHNDCGDGTGATLPLNVHPVPAVSLTACNDLITTLSAQSFRLKGGVPPGGDFSGPGVTNTAGIYYFTPASALGTGNKIITYTYTNTHVCSSSAQLTILVKSNSLFTCGGNLQDVRDNQDYPTFSLPGNKCWMAKNLNYGNLLPGAQPQSDNCVNEKFCPGNIVANCTAFGGFYQWDELMQYDAGAMIQGLCPPGWHIPTETEWLDLVNYYQGGSLAGAFLKDNFLLNGFHAILGGVFFMNTSWAFLPSAFSASFYWTSSPTSPPDPYRMVARSLNSGTPSVPYYKSSRANAFPVRCVKD